MPVLPYPSLFPWSWHLSVRQVGKLTVCGWVYEPVVMLVTRQSCFLTGATPGCRTYLHLCFMVQGALPLILCACGGVLRSAEQVFSGSSAALVHPGSLGSLKCCGRLCQAVPRACGGTLLHTAAPVVAAALLWSSRSGSTGCRRALSLQCLQGGSRSSVAHGAVCQLHGTDCPSLGHCAGAAGHCASGAEGAPTLA